MDLGDAFVVAYDALAGLPGNQLAQWASSPDQKSVSDQVYSEGRMRGTLPDEWVQGVPISPQLLGVLLGLRRALLNADPDRDAADHAMMGLLQQRYLRDGRLNTTAVDGALIFRRAIAARPDPRGMPDTLADMVPELIRVPEMIWSRAKPDERVEGASKRVPTTHDLLLPWKQVTVQGRDNGGIGRRPIGLAQLPFLADRADVVWRKVIDPYSTGSDYYTVGPNSERLMERIPAALGALDASGAELAVLPEACLDEPLLRTWQETLSETWTRPHLRPESSQLTWILVGTGPIVSQGAGAMSATGVPNRAVLLHRDGSLLLTQDKRCGFTLEPEQQLRYGIADILGGTNKLGEYLAHGSRFNYLDGAAGRFGMVICEEHQRLISQTGPFIGGLGMSHILVPIIAPAMWSGGWQAVRATVIADDGCAVVVSNSLAIDQFIPASYGGGHAPTLLAAIPARGGAYGSCQLVWQPSATASLDSDPRINSLTPRQARV